MSAILRFFREGFCSCQNENGRIYMGKSMKKNDKGKSGTVKNGIETCKTESRFVNSLPVIKEVFHKTYPEEEKIILLSTEYTVSRIHEEGENLLHSIRSDLLLE